MNLCIGIGVSDPRLINIYDYIMDLNRYASIGSFQIGVEGEGIVGVLHSPFLH